MPKALVLLGRGADAEPVVVHALRSALRCAALTDVVVVAPADPEGMARLAAALQAGGLPGPDAWPAHPARVQVVPGGAERSDSVARGLAALPPEVGIVLVHDAARALTPADVFARVVAAVREGHAAVTPALPVVDTVKQVEIAPDGAETVVTTVDRSTLRAIQTPQGFLRETLERAHCDIEHAVTDDAGLVEALGGRVHVVLGDPLALKITTSHDLEVAAGWLDVADDPVVATAPGEKLASLPRTGIGVDVHAWAPEGSDRPLWLGCLEWPGERGIEGHSDGDVLAHAAGNALLSAAGLGDLGTVFGTDRPQMAGASGAQMLSQVADLLGRNGLRIGNVSVQLVARRPRVDGRRAEMEAAMSAALGGALVSITAATTDGLGFVGRSEGLVGIATALVAGS